MSIFKKRRGTFTSPVDGCTFEYMVFGGTLSYKIDGCDWQDFIVADKRAYDDYQYKELLSLFEEVAYCLKKCYSYVMCMMLGYPRTNYHIEVQMTFSTEKMLVNSHLIKHTG